MAIPSWASSIVLNYRNQFKAKYGKDTTLSDDQVWHIASTVFHDADNALQDEYRVEAMCSLETLTNDEPDFFKST